MKRHTSPSNTNTSETVSKKARTTGADEEAAGTDSNHGDVPFLTMTEKVLMEMSGSKDSSLPSLSSSPSISVTSPDLLVIMASEDDQSTATSVPPNGSSDASAEAELELAVAPIVTQPIARKTLTYIAEKACKVFAKIMGYVFAEDRDIRPFYFNGKLRFGIYTDPLFPCRVEQRNIDIEPLLVSKLFHEIGIQQLYGSNHFVFNDPSNFNWWIYTINPLGLKALKSLTITIQSGWTVHRLWRRSMDPSIEQSWCTALRHLRDRHALHNFTINLLLWDDVAELDAFNMPEKIEVSHHRLRLINILRHFRNIKHANIFCPDGSGYMDFQDRANLSLLMAQHEEACPRHKNKLQWSIGTIRVVNALREEDAEEAAGGSTAGLAAEQEHPESELRGGCLMQYFLNRYEVWGEAEEGSEDGRITGDERKEWLARREG